MEIFISWSGPRSGAVAEGLKKWLPKIVNAFRPWLSSEDIDKGARWNSEVAGRLATAKAGIIVLTPENLQSPWILFEAGALSKTLENTFVCPLLVGLEPTDVTGPLSQFQATRATRAEILQLLKTLNQGSRAAMPEAHIEEVFQVWWPKLESELQNLPAGEAIKRPRRTDRDLIEELVDLVRNQSRMPSKLSTAFRLTEEQEKTAFEVLRFVPHKSLQIGSPVFRYIVETAEGKKFEVSVPSGIPIEDIEGYLKPQLALLSPSEPIAKSARSATLSLIPEVKPPETTRRATLQQVQRNPVRRRKR